MAARIVHQHGNHGMGFVVLAVLLALVAGCSDRRPSVPADTHLAYIAHTSADHSRIFIEDLHDGARTVLAKSVMPLEGFQWSPDGGRIVYQLHQPEDDAQVVEIADAAGSTVWTSEGPRDMAPTWRPDGGALAFVRSNAVPGELPDPDRVQRVRVVASDGTRERPVTDPPAGANDDVPVWSPSGRRLAFQRTTQRGDDPGMATTAVHTAAVDGGSSTPVTEPFDELHLLSWSPDGQRLAFVADGALQLVTPDGSDPRRITSEDSAPGHVVWAPDGQRIAFLGVERAYVATASGDDQPRAVTPPPQADLTEIAWSPDGRQLAVAAAGGVGEQGSGLYRVEVQGGDAIMLADPRDDVTRPAWSPDGQLLAFEATEQAGGLLGLDAVSDVFIVHPDGSDLFQVTGGGNSHSPRFQP